LSADDDINEFVSHDTKEDINFNFNLLYPSILRMTWEEVAQLPQQIPILSEIPQSFSNKLIKLICTR